MNLMAITSRLRGLAGHAALIAAAISAAGCGELIYDHDKDCEPRHRVRFRYDYNLKKADAFAQEVNAVTLYVTDPETGEVVWSRTDSSDAVRQEGYTMDLDGLKPGRYRLLAWGGDGHAGSPCFSMGEGGREQDLTAMINRDQENIVDSDLPRLYKDLDFEYNPREFSSEWGEYIHTVRLMKNTNDIHVVLQHLSGNPLDPADFTFDIESPNGFMDHNNRLVDDMTLTYLPWRVRSGLAAGFVPENLDEARFSAVIADFTVGRLVAGVPMWLTIRRADNAAIVARVPVTDYSLMVKGHYEDMPDQEYLDRQDDYSMVFFLDEGLRWIDTYIYINSWHVVLQNKDL